MSEHNGTPPVGGFTLIDAVDAEIQRVRDREENETMLAQEREPPAPKSKTRDPHPSPPLPPLVLTPASQVVPEVVHWLWYPYLPLGKLCLLGGDPGLGKTWVALGLAAAFSLGRWPFVTPGEASEQDPGQTVFCASEDGVADTLTPRLKAMGADLDRIVFLEGKKDQKGHLQRIVMNEEDILVDAITQCKAKLLIFDPFQRFLPPKTKMNEMETVSPVVSALMRVAQRTKATVLLLGHLNKAKQETLGYKFLGSVDWFAAARSALLIMKNPDVPMTDRFLYQVKNSLAPQAGGVAFALQPGDNPFAWGNQTTVSAEEMFTSASNGSGKKTKADAAQEFLRQELAAGEQASDDLMRKAQTLDIGRNALFEAKVKLGIKARKVGFNAGWTWSLPVEEDDGEA